MLQPNATKNVHCHKLSARAIHVLLSYIIIMYFFIKLTDYYLIKLPFPVIIDLFSVGLPLVTGLLLHCTTNFNFFFASETTLGVLYRSWHAESSGVLRIFVSRKVFEKNGSQDF